MKVSSLTWIIMMVCLYVIQSCQTYSEDDLEEFDKQIKTYVSENKLEHRKTTSGLYYHIINEGTSRKIKYTDSVFISYVGELLNGKIIDKQEKPIQFSVRDLLKGWQEGLSFCGENAQINLIIPPQLGYGDNELDDIPPHSILRYSIKVSKIK